MTTWIILVAIAQFIYAIVALIDKYILTSNTVPKPLVYAFFVNVLSAMGIVLFAFSFINIPFDNLAIPTISNVESPTLLVFFLSLIYGYTFLGALILLFSAFKTSDTSDVVPVVGSVAAVSTLLLSSVFLGFNLSPNFLIGFIFLIFGTLLVSHFRFKRNTIFITLFAGILFGANSVILKILFENTSFDNGYFWSRIALSITAFSLFLLPTFRKKISGQTKKTGAKGGVFVIGNKILSGFAGIMILKAIQLGDVSIVQALAGLQFVFLLAFAILFGHKVSKDCGENCQKADKIHKFISVSIIVIGFIILFM